MRALLLLLAVTVTSTFVHSSEAKYSHDVTVYPFKRRKATPAVSTNHGVLTAIPRGGAFGLPANQLAKLYVGFTGINGVAMALLPTIAANLYGSAFDDSKESLLSTFLLERQGDAVLGTSILLQLSTFNEMPITQSVAWSTVPYVVSLVKFVVTGQVTTLGFDSRVALALLLSILLPALNIVAGGWKPAMVANLLATLLLLYGAFGSFSPGSSASVEGLDIASSPGEFAVSFA